MKPTKSGKSAKATKSIWAYPLTWFFVVAAAAVLAVATPREPGVMGRLPSVVGQLLQHKPAVLVRGEERILALITFHRSQRKDVESWISGLQLNHDRSIPWVRMPVVNDPGDPASRAAAEDRLLARYASAQERSNLVPVFTDRAAFVQSAGLDGTDRAYVLVINRSGDVLARVAGEFDETKAQTVRDTLLLHDL